VDHERIDSAWHHNMVQADQAMQRAVETFYLACDKEIAVASAFKALGLDPRDAPKFGWNQMAARPQSTVIQTMTAPANGSSLSSKLGKALGIGLLGAAVAGVPALLVYLSMTAAQQHIPLKPPEPVEFELRWKVVDGKMQQEVVPVEPKP